MKRGSLIFIIGLFLTILGAKFWLIESCGSDLPVWDQWNAEAEGIYQPWTEGRLKAADLLTPHNEHRILYTRVLALGLVAANGQWDCRLQMAVNAILHSLIFAALAAAVRPHLRPLAFGAFCVFLAALFSLPLSFENTLCGFQSQFYFVLLLALLQLAGTTLTEIGSKKWHASHLAAAAGLLAMASGFLPAAVMLVLIPLRMAVERRRPNTGEYVAFAVSVGIVVAGYLLTAEAASHSGTRVATLHRCIQAMLAASTWPIHSDSSVYLQLLYLTLALLPFCLLLARCRKERRADPFTFFVLAVAGWWLLQSSLLAYARGGPEIFLAPRYFDMLLVGPVASFLAWARLLTPATDKLANRAFALHALAATLWLVGLGFGLRQQLEITRDVLQTWPKIHATREANVRDFVAGTLPSLAGKQPWYELPYPNAGILENVLRHKGVRGLLPPSVRPSLVLTPDPSSTKGFARHAGPSDVAPTRTPSARWTSSSRQSRAPATFTSQPVVSPFPLLQFHARGDFDEGDASIYLLADNGSRVSLRPEKRAAGAHLSSWEATMVRTPEGPFRVVAQSAPDRSLALGEPVEWGRLGWWAYRVIVAGPWLVALGIALLIGAGIGLRKSPPRKILPDVSSLA